MPFTIRVLIGLVAGLAAGIGVALVPSLGGVVPIVEPVGTLFIAAIRMTVIPLVVASLVVGVAAADARAIGRVGWRAVVLFVVVLAAGSLFVILLSHPLLSWYTVPAAASASLRAAAGGTGAAAAEGAKQIPGFAQWLVSLVPVNPVRAASDGAMLPLIVFSLAFGVALLRVPEASRHAIVSFFRGVFDAMLVIVRWVLWTAPVGVFALSLVLGARLGVAAAGAAAYYVVLVSALVALFAIVVLYPMAALGGRVPLRRFARAATPAQAVAFSSRSSLASLPVMMEDGSARLGFPPAVTTFFLPLAASVFRAGAGVGLTFGVLFLARLYGVAIGPAQMVTIVAMVVVTSLTIPGIPSGSIIAMVPIMLAVNVPVDGIGILLGLDTIPDMFRTLVNVTGDLAAATVVARAPASEAADSRSPESVSAA